MTTTKPPVNAIEDLPENLRERISKTLGLAKAAGTPGEAAAAASMLNALLNKYRLTVEQVEQYRSAKEVSHVLHRMVVLREGDKTVHAWIVALGQAVANCCECKVLFGPTLLLFVGPEMDVRAAEVMFINFYSQTPTLLRQAEDHRAAELRKRRMPTGWKGYGVGNPKKVRRDWQKSWLVGFALGIDSVIRPAREEFRQNHQALMVVHDQQIEVHIKEHFPKTHPHQTRNHDVNLGAFTTGVIKGKEVGQQSRTPRLGGASS